MGILDDAIREHLELKRKHGAAEDELERQEEEALGPARREVAPAQAQDGNGAGEPEAAEPSADGESAADAQLDGAATEAPEAEAVSDPPTESVPEPEPESQPEAELESVPELAPESATPKPEPESDPEPEPDPEPDHAAVVEASEPPGYEEPRGHEESPVPPGDTPPRGFEPVDEDGEDGDVLHDTPDFLQETPEHDRLWFEQKPPRDFDFD